MFKPVDTKVSFPELERNVLEFWKERRIFERSIEERQAAPKFVFYEGPPTANGLPGVHHVLARSFKDIFNRYKTMRGFYVPRKSGWDCHGLPVELEIEKELGFHDKQAIENYGIAKFNAKCRQSVQKYVAEWEKMSDRIAFWVDNSKGYWTMSNDYIESVWWILQRIWESGMIYRGHKVVPYCPRCGTPLSSHEVAQGYAEVEDPSVYVRFPLEEDPSVSLLAWTTTPWTLPGNVALAIHPDLEYVMVKQGDDKLILAKDLLDKALEGEYEIIKSFTASELTGKKYQPPYSFVKPDKPAYYVILADYVTAEDGTGIVHTAPAFGEDDMSMSVKYGLPVLQPVDLTGRFTEAVQPWAGMFVKDADPRIIKDLENRGILYRVAKIKHTYPFCWRCDTPLLYYARASWFIGMSRIRDRLIENNRHINWYPSHIKEGRFGNWLEGVNDWAVSRERFWGTPLPMWICDDCHAEHMIGSFAELRERSLTTVPDDFDPHRPFVDDIEIKCPSCGSTMHRVEEVLDCWFDSGSMPIGQWHYPFENQEVFKESFPAEFISEAVDQTRGWFYSLHAISTLLFDQPCYKNVVVLGLVLGENGERMSKSRGNVINPWSILDVHGADALRWYLYTASPPGNARRFSVDLVGEVVRKFVLTLWNTYSFFVTYANIDNFDPTKWNVPPSERTLMDRWALSELNSLIQTVNTSLDEYDVTTASRSIEAFVDELSNWYVRRNRRRFWKSENDADKAAAYLTLYECLTTVAKLMAPFTPFVADELYRNLVCSVDSEATESVHLTLLPEADETLIDTGLSAGIQTVMKVVSLGRAARNKSSLKVRQPLSEVVIKPREPHEAQVLERFGDQVLEELNVRDLRVTSDAGALVTYTIKPNLAILGPKYGKDLQIIRKAMDGLDAAAVARKVQSDKPIALNVDEREFILMPEEVLVTAEEKQGYSVVEDGGYLVAINTVLTADLVEEGLVRDFVRLVQNMRKSAGFEIQDQITTYYQADEELAEAIEKQADYVKAETLTTSLVPGESHDGAYTEDLKIGKHRAKVAVRKS